MTSTSAKTLFLESKDALGYNPSIDAIRREQYPQLNGITPRTDPWSPAQLPDFHLKRPLLTVFRPMFSCFL